MELTQILRTYGPLGEDCIADLNRVAKVARFNAGDYLIRQGEECKSFYFVRDGILRVCHQTEKKEDTLLFGTDGDIYTPLQCWIGHEISDFSLIPVIESEVYSIPYTDINALMDKYPEFVKWMMLLCAGQLRALELKYIMFCNLSPEERLIEFMSKSDSRLGLMTGKTISRKVPLKMIASWLGVRPETLSRIRRKLVKQTDI